MRKYDRIAAFNIILKTVLFSVVFAGVFCLMVFGFVISFNFALPISAVLAVASVLEFSFLLRYTRFYFAYYSVVSTVLYREKTGRVYCPCCDKHFEHFMDERYYADEKNFNPLMFSKSRQDVICGFCRSAPRHRIIAEWAQKNIELLKGSKILYFAPELSMMLWFKRNGIKVRTADLFDKRADIKLDLTAIDLPDESEDIIFCNHVLEHVSDHNAALADLHRVLRKGGLLIISFPVDNSSESVREQDTGSAEERIRLFGQYDHLRVFGKDSQEMLEKAGFRVDTVKTGDMPADIVPANGPADYDTNEIFCCIRE